MFKWADKIQADPSTKGVFALSLQRILYANQNKSLDRRYKICKQPLFVMPFVIYTKKNFYLLNALNDKIGRLRSSGLIAYWRIEEENLRLFKSQKSNEALRLKHLGGCFQVWILGCLLGLTVVVFENMIAKVDLILVESFSYFLNIH